MINQQLVGTIPRCYLAKQHPQQRPNSSRRSPWMVGQQLAALALGRICRMEGRRLLAALCLGGLVEQAADIFSRSTRGWCISGRSTIGWCISGILDCQKAATIVRDNPFLVCSIARKYVYTEFNYYREIGFDHWL